MTCENDACNQPRTGIAREADRLTHQHCRTEIERLRLIETAARKCMNVDRGYRAEDPTAELPEGVTDDEVEAYYAELKLTLYRLLDEPTTESLNKRSTYQ